VRRTIARRPLLVFTIFVIATTVSYGALWLIHVWFHLN
jgi:hypothetical protein